MVCNTIYLFHKRFQKEVKTPIIDLRKEVKNFLFSKSIKKTAILGTPLTLERGLYKFGNLQYFDLTRKEIKLLRGAIFNFNKGFKKEKQINICRNLARKYLKKGSEVIILGCTEVAEMLKNEKFPKIDPLDILIDASIKESLK